MWEYLKYNNTELSQVFLSIGTRKVKVFLDRTDVRHVWIINPITDKPLKVGLASGWTPKLRIYEEKPIHKSAWIKEIRLIQQLTKAKITPFLYGKKKSLMERSELIKNGKKMTKTVRKENEKANETLRKHPNKRLETSRQVERFSDQEPLTKIDWRALHPIPSTKFPNKSRRRQ